MASTICAFLLVGGSVAAADIRTSRAPSIAAIVDDAAARFGLPASWIAAVMRIESGGRTLAVSPKGAMGLMQIMPRTWAALRPRYGLGADPFDPRDNVAAGTAYLRDLFDRYGSPGFLAAYNAGPGRYETHLATGRPLPTETTAYVARVAPILGDSSGDGAMITRAILRPSTESPLFAPQFKGVSNAAGGSIAGSIESSEPISPIEQTSVLKPRSGGLFATGFLRTGSR